MKYSADAATPITTGYAKAVQPSVQTISTDTAGIDAATVSIPVQDGELPGYQAQPAGNGVFPVILVVQEIFGVHEHIKDVCRRLAKLGYLAIAPDLFARQGDVASMTDIGEIMSHVVNKVTDRQVLADLDATLAWLQRQDKADTDRLGITGFCWGGRITWLYCAHSPAIKAGVAWYGRLEGEHTERQPRQPIDIATRLHAPVLGLYGGADQGIPLESIARMQAALATAHSPSNIVIYPDAPHAFFADYRPGYRAADAQDGWRRLLAWFGAHGIG